MVYTTANFLTSVDRQAFLPTGQVTFATSDILSMGDEVIQRYIMPAILGVREEYFIASKSYDITANQAEYLIPPRSVGAILREVQILDQNNNVRTLERSDLAFQYSTSASSPDHFYLRSDKMVLNPTPSSTSGTLRVYYPLRCGDLIATTAAAVISAINTSTNVVTVTTIPSSWATGDIFDLISRQGSQLYLAIDNVSTTVSGTDITFSSLPSDLAVGDYVSPVGTSPLIQLPAEFRPVLSTLVAAEMLLSMNQPSGEQLLNKGMKDLHNAQKMIAPRSWGSVEIIQADWT